MDYKDLSQPTPFNDQISRWMEANDIQRPILQLIGKHF